jgi:hypothetical protein
MSYLVDIALTALAALALGALWYSPYFLGKPWARLARPETEARPLPYLVFPYLAWCLISYVLSLVLVGMGAYSVGQGMESGFWAWLGLSLPFGIFLIYYERRSVLLVLIDQAYYLAAFFMIGAMLATW